MEDEKITIQEISLINIDNEAFIDVRLECEKCTRQYRDLWGLFNQDEISVIRNLEIGDPDFENLLFTHKQKRLIL